jgi:hypothetical protein
MIERMKKTAKKSGLWIRIHFSRIQIQRLRLETNTDPDPDPIRIQGFNDQKITAEIFIFYFFIDQKLQFTYP